MESNQGIHVLTLANSIIGVSILAMPYCFKQCGIILSILLLIISSVISRLTCHFLLKSAIKARLRTFEYLAYHVFGSFGKLFVEIGLIGFLLGTCIAFFVVMGDLGPQIVTEWTDLKHTDTMRTCILCVLAFLCVLPLGLLRNVDSLSAVSTATIGFYGCLVLKVMAEAAPHLLMGDWIGSVNFWRPAGLLQCLPIFSMALFCQTQLFEIYQAIPNASLEKMNEVVRLAVTSCTCVYIFVGVFGYIALSNGGVFTGNVLTSFKPSMITEFMKLGFVLSVAFSFPLVIFPCRASLYSLIYKPTYMSVQEASVTYIPETRFRLLTFIIVLISLIIGVLIPNIELVLGLVGSTIGVMICVLFPATCFICTTSKNTNERILAQIMLFIGILVMVLGTYANLYAIEEVSYPIITERNFNLDEKVHPTFRVEMEKSKEISLPEFKQDVKEIRHEPPQPEEPMDEPKIIEKEIQVVNKKEEVERIVVVNKTDNRKDEVDKEAIQKEDKELLEQNKNLETQQLLETQKKIVEEQKQVLAELKKQKQEGLDMVEQEKLKAVKNIETLARLAIESIVIDNKPNNNPLLDVLSKDIVKPERTEEKQRTELKPEDVKFNDNLQINENMKLPPIPIMSNNLLRKDDAANLTLMQILRSDKIMQENKIIDQNVKLVQDVKQIQDVKQVQDVKPVRDVIPVQDVKAVQDVKQVQDVKPVRNVKQVQDAKQVQDVKQVRDDKIVEDRQQDLKYAQDVKLMQNVKHIQENKLDQDVKLDQNVKLDLDVKLDQDVKLVRDVKLVQDSEQVQDLEEVHDVEQVQDVVDVKHVDDVKHVEAVKHVEDVKRVQDIDQIRASKPVESIKRINSIEPVKQVERIQSVAQPAEQLVQQTVLKDSVKVKTEKVQNIGRDILSNDLRVKREVQDKEYCD